MQLSFIQRQPVKLTEETDGIGGDHRDDLYDSSLVWQSAILAFLHQLTDYGAYYRKEIKCHTVIHHVIPKYSDCHPSHARCFVVWAPRQFTCWANFSRVENPIYSACNGKWPFPALDSHILTNCLLDAGSYVPHFNIGKDRRRSKKAWFFFKLTLCVTTHMKSVEWFSKKPRLIAYFIGWWWEGFTSNAKPPPPEKILSADLCRLCPSVNMLFTLYLNSKSPYIHVCQIPI